MRKFVLIGAMLLVGGMWASVADAQIYYGRGPAVFPYAVPNYSYYGGWYPGSYGNIYGNYGSYHVMTPYWNGGYRYRYW